MTNGKWKDEFWGKTAWQLGKFYLVYNLFGDRFICEVLVQNEDGIWCTMYRDWENIKTEEDARYFLESKLREILSIVTTTLNQSTEQKEGN